MRSNHRLTLHHPYPRFTRPARLVGHFFVHFSEVTMNPINAKAVLELAVTVIATITNEVLAARKAAKRDADSAMEERNDRPS